MKKAISVLLALILTVGLCSCSLGKDKRVTAAIDILEAFWAEEYSRDYYKEIGSDGHFEIKNTRIIQIKDNNTDMFKDIDYIVEFVLFTDYYGGSLYYESTSVYNSVIVYTDGRTKVDSDYVSRYRNVTLSNDYSAFIESIDDFGDKYNCTEKLI